MIITLNRALSGALDALLLSLGVEPPLGVVGAVRGGPPLHGNWVRLPFADALGEREGATALAVGLSPSATVRLTEAMTGVGAAQQDAELQGDTVSELANILAGNLQPLVPGTIGLRLPARIDAMQAATGPGLRFDCGQDGIIEVRVLGDLAAA